MVVLSVMVAMALTGSITADLVLGQGDFSSDLSGVTASSLLQPSGVTVDGSGNLYVADLGNNRVLGFKDATSLTNGSLADLVLGQPDFVSGSPNNGGLSADSLDQARWGRGGRRRQPLRRRYR